MSAIGRNKPRTGSEMVPAVETPVVRGGKAATAPKKRQRPNGCTGTSRRLTQAGQHTRVKMLDAAEELFAKHGYYGASLRDLSESAGVHLALTTYHFGTKRQLFNEVVKRRAATLGEMRLALMKKVDLTNASQPDAVRGLVHAYVAPLVEGSYSTRMYWRNYVQLMAGIVNVKQWTPIIREYYDEVYHEFLARFQEQFPNADKSVLLNAMSFMIGAMMSVCAQTERFPIERGSKAAAGKKRSAMVLADLVSYCHGGFFSLCDQMPDRGGRRQKIGGK